MATQFNQTDNASFDNIKDAGFLPRNSRLFNLLPSTLNFSTNCYATAGYMATNYLIYENMTPQEEMQKLYFLTQGFRAALPPSHQNSTNMAEIRGYISALQLEPLASKLTLILNNTVDRCINRQIFEFPPGNVDLSQDCNKTVSFWKIHVIQDIQINATGIDTIALLRSALPRQYESIPDRILALPIMNEPLVLKQNVTSAATTCARSACLALNYPGNGDLGGIGVAAASGSIATVTTLIFIIGMLTSMFWTRSSKPVILKAAVKSAEAFRSTVIFFSFMTAIAGIYFFTTCQSIYERSLNALLGFLCTDVCLAMIHLKPNDTEKDDRHRGLVLWSSGITAPLLIAFNFFALSELANKTPQHFVSRYEDFGCYLEDTTILSNALKIAIFHVTFICLAVVGALLILIQRYNHLDGARRSLLKQSSRLEAWYKHIVAFIGVAAMWACFALIIRIRGWSREAFGPSWDDNSPGYGQIIAMFFGIEAVCLFLYIFIHESNDLPGPLLADRPLETIPANIHSAQLDFIHEPDDLSDLLSSDHPLETIPANIHPAQLASTHEPITNSSVTNSH